MIIELLIKAAFAIAHMSKKASTIYISILSALFLFATGFITFGLIYWNPGAEGSKEISLPIFIVGCVFIFLILLAIAITTISSNYVKRNPDKDPKKNPNSSKGKEDK